MVLSQKRIHQTSVIDPKQLTKSLKKRDARQKSLIMIQITAITPVIKLKRDAVTRETEQTDRATDNNYNN